MDPISTRNPLDPEFATPTPGEADAAARLARESPPSQSGQSVAQPARTPAVAALLEKHSPSSSRNLTAGDVGADRFLELPPSGDPIGLFASPPREAARPLATAATENGSTTVYRYADGREEVRSFGSRAWRNNNPGNLRASPEEIGHTGSAGTRFAAFPDAAAGERALRELLSSEAYATKTIDEAIQRYAPSFENDTEAYQAAIRRGVGVPGSTRIVELTNLQFNGLLDTIRLVEGWQAGAVSWR